MASTRLRESSTSDVIRLVAVSQLMPPSAPVRTIGVEDGIEELTSSLAQQGVLQPLIVRPISGAEGRYEVVAGDRRRRAAVAAGLAEVPCVVCDADREEAFVLGLIENIQRSNLHPLDEAWAYDRMIETGVARNRAEVARYMGVTRARITQRMALLRLDDGTKRKLVEYADALSECHARLLLRVKNLAERHHLAEEAGRHGLSGRELRALIEGLGRRPETTESPRSHHVSIPGLRIFVDYAAVDAARGLGVLHGIAERLERLYADTQRQFGEAEEEVTRTRHGRAVVKLI
jgi:ParB family chromosome partitioning protein